MEYCDTKRNILPTVYCPKKRKNAFLWNNKTSERRYDENESSEEEEANGDIEESKAKIQHEIRQKITAMDGLNCIDVYASDSEIDDIQSIMENGNNEDDAYDTDQLFVPVETNPVNTSKPSHTNNVLLHRNDNHNQAQEFKVVHLPFEKFSVAPKKNDLPTDKLLSDIRKQVPDKYPCSYVRRNIVLKFLFH